jgi:hypothetical protein
MSIFRRGSLWLVYHSLERCYIFDAATNEFTGDRPYVALIGDEGRHWLPILDRDEVPEALHAHLILRMSQAK